MLKKLQAHGAESEEVKKAKDTAITLAQTALIDSGYELTDPSELVSNMYRLMSQSLGVDPDAVIEEVEVPEEEPETDEALPEEEADEESVEEESLEEATEEKTEEEVTTEEKTSSSSDSKEEEELEPRAEL